MVGSSYDMYNVTKGILLTISKHDWTRLMIWTVKYMIYIEIWCKLVSIFRRYVWFYDMKNLKNGLLYKENDKIMSLS